MPDEPQRSLRIEARITPDALLIVKRAAELQGRSVSDFVAAAARDAARRAIEDEHLIRLSVEDQIQFAELILNPAEASPALTRAKAAHTLMVRKSI